MNDYRRYDYNVSNEFVGVMPEIIDEIGAVGTVKETDIDTSIFTHKGRLVDVNLICPSFDGFLDAKDNTIVSTPEEIGEGDGNKMLSVDLEVSKPVEIKGNVTLDLNGKTIKNTVSQPIGTASPAMSVQAGAKLMLNGDGTLDGGQGGDNNALLMYSDTEVKINGGTYTVGPDANGAGNSCIYLYGSNVNLEITGGEYRSEKPYNGKYYVVNSQNSTKDTNTIVITGGKFWDFDPSNVDIEVPAKNYVPDGYKVTKETVMDGETEHTVYTVVKA